MFPIDHFKQEPTPFYYYDIHLLDETLREMSEYSSPYGFHVHYAVKANANPELLKRIAAAGFGADTVSIGEINAAISAGFPAAKIVFAGVGKTDYEISEALKLGIGCFNAESEPEIERLEENARQQGKIAPVALRVNPEIDAHTHHYITTGLAENKFGIAMEMLDHLISKCMESEWINLRGLHFHIGSQITDLEPFKILCQRINTLQEKYADVAFPTINVGGGLGIDYENPDAHPVPDFKSYFDIFHNNLKLRPQQQLHFELGRAVVAQCGSLVCRVVYVKEGVGKKFAILDGGMSVLIRPALYQAHHKIENITSKSEMTETYDVVGPICESSDTFGTEETLPKTSRGDLIVLRSAGAYGETMACGYNCRPLPSSVYSR